MEHQGKHIGESSNGRTAGFDPANLGPNPSSPFNMPYYLQPKSMLCKHGAHDECDGAVKRIRKFKKLNKIHCDCDCHYEDPEEETKGLSKEMSDFLKVIIGE